MTVGAFVIAMLLADAGRAQSADQLMRQVAAQTSDSLETDPPRSVGEMLAAYDRGERLHIACGHLAWLAKAVLQRAGHQARLVNVVTRGPYDFKGDGHSLVEVRVGGRWLAYDPYSNRQPLDARGRGIRIAQMVKQRPFRWRIIADDPLYHLEPSHTHADVDRAYDRAFGVALIEHPRSGQPGFAFHDRSQRDRLEGLYGSCCGYHFVGKRVWEKLKRPREARGTSHYPLRHRRP